MTTQTQINLSKDFQVYDRGTLVKSCKTLAEARRQLADCSPDSHIVYPSWALLPEALVAFGKYREVRE